MKKAELFDVAWFAAVLLSLPALMHLGLVHMT